MAAPEEPSVVAVPDVFLSGLLFYDIGFTGLDSAPTPGTEIWTKGMGSSPAYDGDRALVTHGQAPPLSPDELIGTPPPSRAAVAHLGPEPQLWIRRAAEAGTMVFGDAGWEEAERWGVAVLEQLALCHAFLPNADEAVAYTRTTTPQAALTRLADLVPLAVVTCGGEGAYAVDSTTGETASVRGLKVDALDATGAGDVFGAALVAATLAGCRSPTGCGSPTSSHHCPYSGSAERRPPPLVRYRPLVARRQRRAQGCGPAPGVRLPGLTPHARLTPRA